MQETESFDFSRKALHIGAQSELYFNSGEAWLRQYSHRDQTDPQADTQNTVECPYSRP